MLQRPVAPAPLRQEAALQVHGLTLLTARVGLLEVWCGISNTVLLEMKTDG
jgi:hypothetical protein